MQVGSEVIAAVIGGAVGGGGLLAVVIKLIFGDKQSLGQAHLDGFDKAAEKYTHDIATLTERFERELQEQHNEHRAQLANLQAQIQRLYAAVLELAKLVDPSKLPEAMEVIARLNVVTSDIANEAMRTLEREIHAE